MVTEARGWVGGSRGQKPGAGFKRRGGHSGALSGSAGCVYEQESPSLSWMSGDLVRGLGGSLNIPG